MPRTRNIKKDKGNILPANILKRMTVEGITVDQMAKALGITPKTFRDKMHKPDGFKLGELHIIFRALKFSESEVLESVFI